MKASIDVSRCFCAGMCVSIAPQVFRLPEDGGPVLALGGDLEGEYLAFAQDAAACCPAEAILIEP
jgi:ferredoxin